MLSVGCMEQGGVRGFGTQNVMFHDPQDIKVGDPMTIRSHIQTLSFPNITVHANIT